MSCRALGQPALVGRRRALLSPRCSWRASAPARTPADAALSRSASTGATIESGVLDDGDQLLGAPSQIQLAARDSDSFAWVGRAELSLLRGRERSPQEVW